MRNREDQTEHSFLQRWSARKLEARKQAEPKEELAEPVKTPPVEEPAARELSDADMPPLDSLNEHSDYSGFFSPKVSKELRRQALRKLFHSPIYNVTDGLDDYAGDYTQFAALGDTVTSDMRHVLEMQAKRIAEQEESTSAGQETDAEATPVVPARETPHPNPLPQGERKLTSQRQDEHGEDGD